MNSKYKVRFKYKKSEDGNYIESVQEFDFSYEFPDEPSSFIPLLAEALGIIEEWIKDVEVS
ncbi:MAG: hypothetical protein JXR03_06445 [Cyclobacteriaceae bacterium]